MSAGFYNHREVEKGFGTTVIISLCLHIISLGILLLFSNNNVLHLFTAPVYTVDLIGQLPAERPIETSLKPEKPEAVIPKAASKPAVKEKAIPLKKEKEASIDEALKKIREQVKKREESEAVNKAIRKLEDKQLEKKIKEIRERVVHKEDIVRPVKPAPESINRGTKAEGRELSERGAAIMRVKEIEEKYAQLIGDVIHDTWNYGGDFREGEAAVIAVRIDKTGRLIESHIEQSSVNIMLVQSAVRAIERAAPLFPPFPKELEKDFVEIGVCFPGCKR
ncbi:MAG: hypothetical protein A3G39_10925 [Deltaproteobacteria bacterium RIFCSPLOWO2_12_FULL_43_16]|nr:MAG: hypothetical protein A2Z89_09020 [Deltaproteobacteria bacterium GWA2_43_19]OGQ13117.1 MAG: hypothetical protein A3D30_09905 [Deltaproteobacteria bacterium RIFCSPHIGHO2_02_FULL_43_33]OGQ33401.1 MAG: hypothetical protein A3A85_01645 [Deltaproteobacteria bacterium RIFCSPLOWO2_01_FULL_42_9]OGQ57390.1 MAG: hypothetical protein A3G39_10925 [Deltaproteobacteria bacterium RIFCSPLOWO2_12_FULL_43_16]HBR16971.1 hypothetical protein [Deltaproteobacteria bacterium]